MRPPRLGSQLPPIWLRRSTPMACTSSTEPDASLALLCILLLPFQGAAIAGIPAGHVVSHGLERDLVNLDSTGRGAGYFTFIEGVGLPWPARNSFKIHYTKDLRPEKKGASSASKTRKPR
jgi:hypothetical protein